MPRRYANGTRLAPLPDKMAVPAFLRGPPLRLGLLAAVIVAAIDQATKLWLLYGFGLTDRSQVPVTSFLDLVLAWNPGISYGLFQQTGPLGQWVLLALKVIAVALLLVWLANPLTPSGFGARADHWGCDRECDRPRGTWCRDGFRPVSYHRSELDVRMVRL